MGLRLTDLCNAQVTHHHGDRTGIERVVANRAHASVLMVLVILCFLDVDFPLGLNQLHS